MDRFDFDFVRDRLIGGFVEIEEWPVRHRGNIAEILLDPRGVLAIRSDWMAYARGATQRWTYAPNHPLTTKVRLTGLQTGQISGHRGPTVGHIEVFFPGEGPDIVAQLAADKSLRLLKRGRSKMRLSLIRGLPPQFGGTAPPPTGQVSLL